MKESDKEEQEFQILDAQTMNTQMMMISQGLYYDNTNALLVNQKIQNDIVNLKLQALDCYTNAAKLGNQLAFKRLSILNAIYGNKTTANEGSSSTLNNSMYHPSKAKCTLCNGTGKIAGTVPTYGIGKNYWCDFCKKEVPASHCCQCKICPSCGGNGYR